jgi:spore coat protein A, manganese oxidase
MLKKKRRYRRRQQQQVAAKWGRKSRVLTLTSLVLCLVMASAVWSRWKSVHTATLVKASFAPEPLPSPTSTPLSKDYIRLGSKIIATEEQTAVLRRATCDYDGDGDTDIIVFRPAEGNWYIIKSLTNSVTTEYLGSSDNILVPGDYDGDGKLDLAVWKPTTSPTSLGYWNIKQSSTNTVVTQWDWGGIGDIPVPADYDRDGRTDKAIFRPSDGNWYIIQSSRNQTDLDYTIHPNWGLSTDKPLPADYDGDGKADLAVFRPSDSNWYIKYSATSTTAVISWGQSGDRFLPADYDGDGKADLAVFRPGDGNWYIRKSSDSMMMIKNWGSGDDLTVPADYDGDGRTDVAIWRPSEGNWYIRKSSSGRTSVRNWGSPGNPPSVPRDIPVPTVYVR